MEPSNPPSVPPIPQMRPLPQPKVPLPAAGVATPPQPDGGATIDEAGGEAAVQLSFWQLPFVQNVLPLLTSLMLHIGILVLGIATWRVVEAIRSPNREQVIVPDAAINEGPEGGIPHPGLGGDPNRDAAQDKFPDVPKDSQGIAEKPSKDLTTALTGGGSGDSSDNVIAVGINGTGMGAGKGSGSGKGDGLGSGSGDGSGLLAPFGVPGGGGGIGPKSTFVGTSGNANKIVYVLDATGSMLPSFDNLRNEVRKSISNLKLPQSFDIVFINENKPPPLAPALLICTPENKRKAAEYVDTMAPRGGTDPLPALEKAFALQPQLIYFLIDPSDFPDQKAVLELVSKQDAKGKIKMNIISFEGDDNPKNQAFLAQLAKQTGGVFKTLTAKELGGN